MSKAKTVKIYGHSDDLIEVRGDVPGCDEYGHYEGPGFVELSTGDVFRIEYGKGGVWRVEHHVKSGVKLTIQKEPHGDGDDPEPYTDTATVTGPIAWVDFWGDGWPPTRDEIAGKVKTAIENGLGDELTQQVWTIIHRATRKRQ